MYKKKIKKSVIKRFKITGDNNYLRKHAYKGHLLLKKSNSQKRKLSTKSLVSSQDKKKIKLILSL